MLEKKQRNERKPLPEIERNINEQKELFNIDILLLFNKLSESGTSYDRVKEIIQRENSQHQSQLYCQHISKFSKDKKKIYVNKAHIFCKCWKTCDCKVEFIVDFVPDKPKVYAFGCAHKPILDEITAIKKSGKRKDKRVLLQMKEEKGEIGRIDKKPANIFHQLKIENEDINFMDVKKTP